MCPDDKISLAKHNEHGQNRICLQQNLHTLNSDFQKFFSLKLGQAKSAVAVYIFVTHENSEWQFRNKNMNAVIAKLGLAYVKIDCEIPKKL